MRGRMLVKLSKGELCIYIHVTHETQRSGGMTVGDLLLLIPSNIAVIRRTEPAASVNLVFFLRCNHLNNLILNIL